MNILTIGGSDPSSSSGIQGDIRTAESLGGYCFTVITSITSQNSKKFFSKQIVSPKMIKDQIRSIVTDYKIDFIIISMLQTQEIIKTVNAEIVKLKIPKIVDPVIISTTGGQLLDSDSIKHYKRLIIKIADVITPNSFEAEKITGIKIKNKNDSFLAAERIFEMGAKNVIITGNKFDGDKITDIIFDGKKKSIQKTKKIKVNARGSGGIYAIHVAKMFVDGFELKKCAKYAQNATVKSLENSKSLGSGYPIANTEPDPLFKNLNNSILDFINIKSIHKFIPECQTNFVFAKKAANNINEVVGVSGRIVKTQSSAIVAGELKFGGSKHVATAVLELSKKFPQLRSAINISYNDKIIKNAIKNNFVVIEYDRKEEPMNVKEKENSTIKWAVKQICLKNKIEPDLIFHKGDFGKEPMILVFGHSPQKVLKKIRKIITI